MNDSAGRPSTDLAMQLLREGKIDECLQCLDTVVAAEPDNATAYSIMGAAYSKSGDNGMAIGAFEHAVSSEESPRTHANLAKAYETAGRTDDAARQYELAVHIDPFYQVAAEGLKRLRPSSGTDAATVMGAPAEETTQPAHHQLLTGEDETTPVGETELQPVGVPVYAPPAQLHATPDLRDLEYRAKVNEEKAVQVQRQMMKSGLIYGVIVGPAGLLGALFLLRLFGFLLNTWSAIIGGIILGAIVGAWTGFTSGDEWSGAKTGALVGCIGQALLAIPYGGLVMIVAGFSGAIIGTMAGYFIGMMVSNSIGWN